MIDFAVLLGALVCFIVLGLLLWRVVHGPAANRNVLSVRTAVLLAFVAPLEVHGAWTLMNSPGFQVLGRLVGRVDTSAPVVALTIDDGPGRSGPEVLKILQDVAVRATFFVNGNALDQNIEMARALVAAGHELGNHTYSHRRMIFCSQQFIRQELEHTDELIRQAGYAGPIQFRPPNGKKLVALPFYLARTGRATIMADVEPDSHVHDSRAMVQYALDHTTSGSIILLHALGLRASREALPGVVIGLRQRGYQFVTVSELLRYER
jgi:peptidoglycan-N-acetylglucosamine deacetylase